MASIGTQVAARDFSKRTLRALAAQGVELQGVTALPDEHGSYANSVRGYHVADNGMGRILLHGEVLARAAGGCLSVEVSS